MRKIDKKLNIQKVNLLSEQRYLDNKNLTSEDWKTNLAAGLATAGAVAGANAQTTKHSDIDQTAIPQDGTTKAKIKDTNLANPYNIDSSDQSMIHRRTLPIVGIQTGVTVGKNGEPAVYVYHNHKPSDPQYNWKRDREIVYVKYLDDLYQTKEYRDYMANLHDKEMNKGVDLVTVN